MSRHTPGPNWECPGKDGDAWVICAQDAQGTRRTIAHVYQESNARLIAKAPEMLSVLRRLTGNPYEGLSVSRVVNDARALLREIEGEK